MRAVGIAQGLRDTVVNLNEKHLSKTSLRAFDAALDEYYAALARPTQ